MADWYCDPSLVQAGYLNYASTPTAAGTVPTKPEDGDGKAIGVAVMATFQVTFTGIPAATGSVTVAGVAFTAVASGATGNQFNAVTDATTCATNLKNAINASTTTGLTKPTATSTLSTAQLRNIVNATSSAGVVTVYTRIASADWNSVTEVSTLTNSTLTQWSGGASGAWGYLFNLASIAWPVSAAAFGYGAWSGTYLGQPVAGDICHIRTRRSGVDITLALPDAVINCTTRNVGTRSNPFTYLADNGIKWSGDAGVLTISMAGNNGAGTRAFRTNATGGCYQILAGVRLTDTTCNWRWLVTGTASTNGNLAFFIGHSQTALDCPVKIMGMEFDCGDNTNSNISYIGFNYDVGQLWHTPRIHLQDVVYKSKAIVAPFSSSNNNQTFVKLSNCVFDHTGATSLSTYAILSSGGYGLRFEAEGCEWRGFPALANQSGFQSYAATAIGVILKDCKYPNIKVQGALVGSAEVAGWEYIRSISVSSSIGNRNYIFENDRKSFAWIDSAAPKTSSAILPDGTTTFSVRTAVTSIASTVSPQRSVRFPRLSKHNTLASGTYTATLKILVDANINTALGSRAPNKDEMCIEVSYVGTDGLPKTVSSCPIPGASITSIASGTAGDWSAVSYDVNGITHTYNAYELSVSVPNVQTLTELGLVYVQGCQSASVDNLVFLDPEWALA